MKKRTQIRNKRTQKESVESPTAPSPAQTPDPALDGRLQKSLVKYGGPMALQNVEPEPTDESFVKRKMLALQLVNLKVSGLDLKQAAEQVGISYGYARNLVSMAGKYGWFLPVDPAEKLELVIAHKVVKNVEEFLDHPHPMIRMDMTKEAARGIGLFKQHTSDKGSAVPQTTVIAIKIENPNENTVTVDPKLIEGKVGGVPMYQDGDVIE